MRLRLRQIEQDVDFRYNELSIYEQYRKSKAFGGDPKKGEAILFVSRAGDQLLWVLHYENDVKIFRSQRRRIESLRFRISGGYWNPAMLQNYANEIGIELEGIKRFEEVFAERRK